MRETSLEDFLSGSDEEAAERAASEDESEADGEISENVDEADEIEETAHDTSDIEPATATYASTPQGVDCPECGESVIRRWRDGDRLVCAECKRW